jgi:hypothetical protein
MVREAHWPNSVMMVLIALLVGASSGYLIPRSVAGKPDSTWLPLTFDESMEVGTETVKTFVPRAPRFVSEGKCRLSGQAKFFSLAEDDHRMVRLGYLMNVAPGAAPAGGHAAAFPGNSTYEVQLSFSLLDADGFQVGWARSNPHALNVGESYSVRGIVDQPLPRELAERVKRVDCHLCFNGIEVP